MNQAAILEAIGGNLRRCEKCEKVFIQYRIGGPARLCPTCKDVQTNPVSVVQERSVIDRYRQVTIGESFPVDGWEAVETPDGIRFKLDRRGGFGQIVIWAETPPRVGDVVNIRHMRATHRRRLAVDVEERSYYVLRPTAKPASGDVLEWVRDGEYPLRFVRAEYVGGDYGDVEYLSSMTIRLLAEYNPDE